MDEGHTDQLVFFAFDLLFLNGESTAPLPLVEHKAKLQRLFREGDRRSALQRARRRQRAALPRARPAGSGSRASSQSAPIGPMRRATAGIWVKSKCLNREEFVVVGWTDPEGSRSHIGALLLGYYTEDGGRLLYARSRRHRHDGQRVEAPSRHVGAAQVQRMPLAEPPPRLADSARRA